MAKLIRRPRIIGAPIPPRKPVEQTTSVPEKKSGIPETPIQPKSPEVKTPTPQKRRTISSAKTEVNSPVSVGQKKSRKLIGEVQEETSIQNNSQENVDIPFRANSSWPPLQWQDIGFTPSTNYKSSPEHVLEDSNIKVEKKEHVPPVPKAKIIEPRTNSYIAQPQQKTVEIKYKLSKTYNGILLPDSVPPRNYDGILNWLSSAYGEDNDFSYIEQESVVDLAISMWLGQLNDEIYKPREEIAKKNLELKIY